jgi:hypothetical protein
MLLFGIKFPKNDGIPEYLKSSPLKEAKMSNYEILEYLVNGKLDDEKVFYILLNALQGESYFNEVSEETGSTNTEWLLSMEIPFQAPEMTTVINADSKLAVGPQTSKPLTLSFSR